MRKGWHQLLLVSRYENGFMGMCGGGGGKQRDEEFSLCDNSCFFHSINNEAFLYSSGRSASTSLIKADHQYLFLDKGDV